MTKYICDRCGAWAEESGNVIFYEPHRADGYRMDGSKMDGHRFVTKREVDLCDDCLSKLDVWIFHVKK